MSTGKDGLVTGSDPPQRDNRKSEDALLPALLAYRARGHDKDQPNAEQQALRELLYGVIDRMAGVAYERGEDGAVTGERPGWLARRYGQGERAEEFANRIKESLEREALDHGSYLHAWREDGGASIAGYIETKARWIAQDMGREDVIKGVAAGTAAPARAGTREAGEAAEESEDDDMAAEETLRAAADRLIAERERAKKLDPLQPPPELPSVDLRSMSDYDEGEEHGDAPAAAVPAQMRVTMDTPLGSALRARKMLANLRVIGDEMVGKTVLVKGKKTRLTNNHRNIWFAFLTLSDQERDYLGESVENLAERYGWSQSSAKRYLADGFAFFWEHPLFDECCDLLLSGRHSRHMDAKQVAEARSRARTLLMGEVPKWSDEKQEKENARDLFRKVILQWIEKYGDT